MITAKDLSWRFIGLPRTGSTLITNLLKGVCDAYGNEAADYDGAQHSCEVLHGATMIVSVRNPYTRLVSLWKHKRYQMGQRRWGPQGKDNRTLPFTEEEHPFQSFISNLGCEKGDRDPFYGWTMGEWLQYIGKADKVIRLENLAQDLCRVFREQRWFPEGVVLPTENTSADAKIAVPPLRDPDVLSRVRAWAYDDCRHFGYPLDPPVELL